MRYFEVILDTSRYFEVLLGSKIWLSKHSQGASRSSPTLGGKPLRPQLIRSPPPPTAPDPSNTLQLHLLPPVPSAHKCSCPPVWKCVSAQKYPSSCICHSLTAPLYNTGTSTPSNTHDPCSLAQSARRVEHLMGSCVDGWIHHTPHG